MKIKSILGASILLLVSVQVNAALFPILGGQAVYDDDLDITWVADANLAASNSFGLTYGVNLGMYPSDASGVSGFINANGTMNWPGALFWIDAVNDANYLGFNDWRLPTALNQDSSGPCILYNCTNSEMGHLFYNELSGTVGNSILTSIDPDLSLFSNVRSNSYWSGTENAPNTTWAWFFTFNSGYQDLDNKINGTTVGPYAWAVRSDDVSVVPVPAAFWLFGTALVGLVGFTKRRNAA